MPPRLFSRVLIALSFGFAALPLATSSAAELPRERSPERIDGRYIVGFRPSVARPGELSDKLEEAEGFETDLRYRHALEGFSARLSPAQLGRLREDPRVDFIVADRTARALESVPLATGDGAPMGVRRMRAATTAETHEASSVNVAVIDTGIDLSHPDLNAAHGKSCVGTATAQDDNGHGTHVAGTIAAENDGARVVGVAPGTRVYAVKVLDAKGSGTWSQVICGIDWATSTRTDADPSNDIAVANMSLGGVGSPVQGCATTTDPLHVAICNSTAAGVTYVVAAGNDGWDFDYPSQPDVPAAYPQVLTVSAVSDSDGLSGGVGGSPACRTGEADDRYASFSNYAKTAGGQAHTVAAPGVCILSDARGGGTTTMSGTSMAAPHIAGQVALCLGEAGTPGPCAGLPPAEIIQKVREDAAAHTAANPSYGFVGDPARPVTGRYYGYLSHVGIAPAPPPPPPEPDSTPPTVVGVSPIDGAGGISPTTSVSVTFSEAMHMASAQSAYSLLPMAGGPAVAGSFSWSGATMTFRPSVALAQGTWFTVTETTAATDVAGNPLASPTSWSFRTLANVTSTPGSTSVESGTLRSGDATRLATDNNSYYEVNSTSSGTRTTSWYGTFPAVSNDLTGLKVTYRGKNSKSCAQTVAIWSYATGSWTQLDSRSVVTSEITIERTPSGALGSYVSGSSGDGVLQVRVRCTRSTSFYASGELLKIAYVRP